MSDRTERSPTRLGVIGAGLMGSGIARNMATEGFSVVLVDLDEARLDRGIDAIRTAIAHATEQGAFALEQAESIIGRIHPTPDWRGLGETDLVVEAVYENLDIKQEVFRRLDSVCPAGTILATNTSSFRVEEIAEVLDRRERVIGLHHFHPPAENRLVEVVPTEWTSEGVREAAWGLMERLGKTPIHSADSPGFVVNRFFIPWLVEAIRLSEEGLGDFATIDAAAKRAFRTAMGPFELMNVAGASVVLDAAESLGRAFGPFYQPPVSLERHVDGGRPWKLGGQVDATRLSGIEERLLGAVFHAAASLVEQGIGSVEDADFGARVGLGWPLGPFELINRLGIDAALEIVRPLVARWQQPIPALLVEHHAAGRAFEHRVVRSAIRGGLATITVDRPEALNAIDARVVHELADAFHTAASDSPVRGIVIAGAGQAYAAGLDLGRYVGDLAERDVERIVEFVKSGHALFNAIDDCSKPVIARVQGAALGAGLELALACDRVVATPDAVFGFPETGVGIYPALGGTQRTARRVGIGMAKALIFTGRRLSAEQAVLIGLIDAVVPRERLDATIRAMIEQGPGEPPSRTFDADTAALARFFEHHAVEDLRTGRVDTRGSESLARAMGEVGGKAPIALRVAERLIDEGIERPLHEGLHMEIEHLIEIFGTRDAYEGLSAAGTRAPRFRGH